MEIGKVQLEGAIVGIHSSNDFSGKYTALNLYMDNNFLRGIIVDYSIRTRTWSNRNYFDFRLLGNQFPEPRSHLQLVIEGLL